MPRSRPQEHCINVPFPITGAEVDAMFRLVISRQPWPDLETCEHLATWFSSLTPEGRNRHPAQNWSRAREMSIAEIQYRQRWDAAVKTLRQTRKNEFSFPGGGGLVNRASDILDAALDDAERILDAAPKDYGWGQTKAWAPWAISIAFAVSSLIEDFGRKGGTSGNSIAARFTALALERIGWRDGNGRAVTAGAIANYCAKPARNTTQ